MKALVVDDSRATRTIIRQGLVKQGFEVIEAGNGREALDRLEANPAGYDVALVDWNMPEMTGYELICAIRSEKRLEKVPIMMITTEAEIGQVKRAIEAGANAYVIKPFTMQTLQEKLQSLGVGK